MREIIKVILVFFGLIVLAFLLGSYNVQATYEYEDFNNNIGIADYCKNIGGNLFTRNIGMPTCYIDEKVIIVKWYENKTKYTYKDYFNDVKKNFELIKGVIT